MPFEGARGISRQKELNKFTPAQKHSHPEDKTPTNLVIKFTPWDGQNFEIQRSGRRDIKIKIPLRNEDACDKRRSARKLAFAAKALPPWRAICAACNNLVMLLCPFSFDLPPEHAAVCLFAQHHIALHHLKRAHGDCSLAKR